MKKDYNNSTAKPISNTLFASIKGLVIGASMLLPGVSGGTMAIILGIYERLIHSISIMTDLIKWVCIKFLNLFRKEKKTFEFDKKEIKMSIVLLAFFCVGAAVGMVLFAGLIEQAITYFKVPMHYFFMGAILGGVPTLYRKAEIEKFKIKPLDIVAVIIGFAIVFGISLLPEGLLVFDSLTVVSFFVLLLAGVVIAIALILPGISTSQMLLLLGIYELVLKSLSNYEFLVLVPLVVGALAGTLLTTKSLEKAMSKQPRFTYLFIIGFVLGSIIDVFPGIPAGMEILYSVVLFFGGFIGIFFLSKFSNGQ